MRAGRQASKQAAGRASRQASQVGTGRQGGRRPQPVQPGFLESDLGSQENKFSVLLFPFLFRVSCFLFFSFLGRLTACRPRRRRPSRRPSEKRLFFSPTSARRTGLRGRAPGIPAWDPTEPQAPVHGTFVRFYRSLRWFLFWDWDANPIPPCLLAFQWLRRGPPARTIESSTGKTAPCRSDWRCPLVAHAEHGCNVKSKGRTASGPLS